MAYIQKILLFFISKLIRLYQYAISPHFPACCRYYPSCSSYAYDALQQYGILRGSFMALKRLLRCHPLHTGGYDPLPQKDFKWTNEQY